MIAASDRRRKGLSPPLIFLTSALSAFDVVVRRVLEAAGQRPKFSWYLGWPVAVIAAKVRPWNELSAVMITGVPFAPSLVRACLRASLIAASFASAPELQKKARSAHDESTSFLASAPCCGM